MVHLEHAEWELAAATVSPALLLPEKDVLVLAVRHRCVDVGAGSDESVVEQVAHGLVQAHSVSEVGHVFVAVWRVTHRATKTHYPI